MKTKAAGKQATFLPTRPLSPTSFRFCGKFVAVVESKNMPRPTDSHAHYPHPTSTAHHPHVMFAESVVGMFAMAACGKWHIINSN